MRERSGPAARLGHNRGPRDAERRRRLVGRGYRYARFGKLYISLEREPLTLIWCLVNATAPLALDLERRSCRGWLRRLPPRPRSYWYVARFVLSLRRPRFVPPALRDTLLLPVDGHVALPLSMGGYKVIDLRKHTVTTLFAPSSDRCSLVRHVRTQRRLGRHDFVPSVLSYDLRQRTLVEEYIDGTPTPMVRPAGEALDDTVLPLLEQFIMAERPREVALHAYLAERSRAVIESLNRLDHAGDRQAVERVVLEHADRLRRRPDTGLGLVLSHGDLWQENVLRCRGVLYAIDWGASDQRAALYDAHFASFIALESEAAERPTLDHVRSRLDHAARWLRRRVQQRAPERFETLFPPQLDGAAHRSLFYLEFMASCARELQEAAGAEVRGLRARRLRSFADIFERFDRFERAA